MCLGCGLRVTENRHGHVTFTGTRDGSWLMASETAPMLAWSDPLPAPRPVYVLGVAHRLCVQDARRRLQAGAVELPAVLPPAEVEWPTGDDGPSLAALASSPEVGRCAYCGAASSSEEHVWPQWVSKLLAARGQFVIMRPGRPASRPSSSINVVTTRVCADCNNTWLSVIENDVRGLLGPMVQGLRTGLSEAQQLVVATWAYRMALMLDLAGGDLVPGGYHRVFRLHRRPAESCVVWTGAYIGGLAGWAEQRPLLARERAGAPLAVLTTFTVGGAVFQVLHYFTTGGATLDDRRPEQAALHRIFPVDAPLVDWPRNALGFGDESLRTLARSVQPSASDSGG